MRFLFNRVPSRTILRVTVNGILNLFGMKLIRTPELLRLSQEFEDKNKRIKLLLRSSPQNLWESILENIPKSKSQLFQDIFVLTQLEFKRDGYFVEVGAGDGKHLSNTYLLEKDFAWEGVIAEPSKKQKKSLKLYRHCEIEDKFVWLESNQEIDFVETHIPELSTMKKYLTSDSNSGIRKIKSEYKVQTISLNDLLSKHSPLNHIDYLSLDTEGSEYEILSSLNFDKYNFSVITCEHNFTDNREKIENLLSSKGYYRVHEIMSEFDDWYIQKPDFREILC